jgi:Zn-dependent peptidase ImmA (M78 family)
MLQVSRQAVSQYERPKGTTPSSEIMDRICSKLGLFPHFFLRPPLPIESTPIFYRSMTSATKTARLRAERRFSWLKEIVLFLQRFLKPIKVNVPTFDVPEDPIALEDDRIEKLAADARRFWNLGDGPISNVSWLLENNGVIVVRHELSANKLDAFSQWSSITNAPMIVLSADKESAVRSRWDAAHEIAHLILHRYVPAKLLNKKELFSVMEDQAHHFAGAFLMPEASFLNDLVVPQLDAMRALKSKWKVAIGAMIKRLEKLEYISDHHARRLWINRTQRGWRTREPFDETLEPEKPRLLQRCFDALLSRGVIAPEDVECNLGFPLHTVERLCSLPWRYFADEESDQSQPQILPFPRSLSDGTRNDHV